MHKFVLIIFLYSMRCYINNNNSHYECPLNNNLIIGIQQCGIQVELNVQWYVDQDVSDNNIAKRITDLKAQVPGGIYSDLMAAGIIPDVLNDYNDVRSRWIAISNWTYSRNFTLSGQVASLMLNSETINLVFNGIDTFADIYLNNIYLGSTQNMFVRYVFPVDKSQFKIDNSNTLTVKLTSPVEMASKMAAFHNIYMIPPNCPPKIYNGACHVNFVRKMQSSFAWDWAPALPSMGIWKTVYIEAFNGTKIRDLLVSTRHEADNYWYLNLTVFMTQPTSDALLVYSVHLVDVPNEEILTDFFRVHHVTSMVTVTMKIPEILVRLWWPNGYGSQPLYNLTVSLYSSGISRKCVLIGFRTVELIQSPIVSNGNSTSGLSFYFKVNNVTVFAKGSNWVPLDLLPEHGYNSTRLHRILRAVQESHMNMIRVWGGGVYESDEFYDLADRFGILIWQDFMYACAMYPATDSFLRNVIDEVDYQIKRLQHHPSIAVWAGNNENEAALVQNWYGTGEPKNYVQYRRDYITLYVSTIRTHFEKLLPYSGTIYLTSSPSNGDDTIRQGYIADNPQSNEFGDIHYYNYLLDSFDTNLLPKPRFISEFGFQSLPALDSWLTSVTNRSELLQIPDGLFFQHRQHLPNGYVYMWYLMEKQFKLPVKMESLDYVTTIIYYSQIIQAMSIKQHVEFYRSRMTSDGGGTMGALFWQLNDVWVAPSWSSIDYHGRWKMLQYYAKNFFAPVIVTGRIDISRKLHIFLVTDNLSMELKTNVTVTNKVFRFNGGFQAVNTAYYSVQLKYGEAVEVITIDTDPYLLALGCGQSLATARNYCFFQVKLEIVADQSNPVPENYVFPGKFADLAVSRKAVIQILSIEPANQRQKNGASMRLTITLESDRIALFVWLETSYDGQFTENGFHQVTKRKIVYFLAESWITPEELQKTLIIQCL